MTIGGTRTRSRENGLPAEAGDCTILPVQPRKAGFTPVFDWLWRSVPGTKVRRRPAYALTGASLPALLGLRRHRRGPAARPTGQSRRRTIRRPREPPRCARPVV